MKNGHLRLCCAVALGSLLLSATVSLAQVAADPQAFELRTHAVILDSADNDRSTSRMFNLGDIDGDGIDDMLTPTNVTDDSGHTTSVLVIERLGLDHVKARDTIPSFSIGMVADWDGDGRADIFEVSSENGAYRYWLNKGIPEKPFFTPAREIFAKTGLRPVVIADINNDGVPDMVSSYSDKLYIYLGPLTTQDTLAPSDSIQTRSTTYSYEVGTFLGTFTSGGRKQLLTLTSTQVNNNYTWAITARLYPAISSNIDLWSATPQVVYTDTLRDYSFVYSPPAVGGDFTGDGFDDLILGDSAHVYVFKGGTDFGSRLLHNADADLMLSSAYAIAPTLYRRMKYPDEITFLGDISGEGTPYIAVTAWTNEDSVGNRTAFLYAGGSAIDPFYDATLTWPNSYLAWFTPMRANSRPALLFRSQDTAGVELDLLRDALQNLPHTQRSAVHEAVAPVAGLEVRLESNGDFVVELPDGARRLRVFNSNGATIADIPNAEHRTVLRSSSWPRGAYTIMADGSQHGMARIIR